MRLYLSYDMKLPNTLYDELFFKQAMDGKMYIEGLLNDKEMKHLVFSSTYYPIEYFENTLNFAILNGLGKMVITNHNGDVLGYDNTFKYIESISYYSKKLY